MGMSWLSWPSRIVSNSGVKKVEADLLPMHLLTEERKCIRAAVQMIKIERDTEGADDLVMAEGMDEAQGPM